MNAARLARLLEEAGDDRKRWAEAIADEITDPSTGLVTRDHLDKRFSRFETKFAEFDTRFAQFEARIERRLTEQDAKLDTRLAQFETRFAQFETRMANFETSIEKKIADIKDQLNRNFLITQAIGFGAIAVLVLFRT